MKYYYFPILKTRPSEVNAYDALAVTIKKEILPIIEMTGEIGYTYTKKCKDESLRGKRRPGDINKKIKKILDFMEDRNFILDITDDETLKYDGLSERNGGLLDPTNGYEAWRVFLSQNPTFKNQVIPTIQFNPTYRDELEKQIRELNLSFDFLALKLPSSAGVTTINKILNFVFSITGKTNLLLILDFGYIRTYDDLWIQNSVKGLYVDKVKAIIPVSSSFPDSVTRIGNNPIYIYENNISECVATVLKEKVYHGDYSSIHPVRYEMGGGGWYARIDYIERDKTTKRPQEYKYARGKNRNTSADYYSLALQVVQSPNYAPVNEIVADGDIRISLKASGGSEGKAPSYWITARSNIYMTMQYLYLKKQGAFLSL